MGRKANQKERDLQIVAQFYLKGLSTRAIAIKVAEIVGQENKGENYSISHKTVSKDIKELLEQWRESRAEEISDQKIAELAKIDHLERTYWEAWEKSIENHKKSSEKLSGELKNKKSKPSKREYTQTEVRAFGEPRYLQGIERCIDKRCKLLGLDAALKMEIDDNRTFIHFLMNTE